MPQGILQFYCQLFRRNIVNCVAMRPESCVCFAAAPQIMHLVGK